MTLEQALQLIDSYLSAIQLNRAQHNELAYAMNLLKQKLYPPPTVEEQK